MKRLITALAALILSVNLHAQTAQTPNLKLQLPPTGQPNWGPTVNRNFSVIDTAVGALQQAYQGPWSALITYSQGQIVTFGGSAYMGLTAGNINHEPDTSPTQWGILSAAGSTVPAPGTAGFAPVSNGSIYTSQQVLLFAARGANNGVASLNSTGQVPIGQIPTITSVNSTSIPQATSADTFLGTTAAGTGAWISVPNCPNDGAHALVYSTSTHTYTCAAVSGGGGGGVIASPQFQKTYYPTSGSVGQVQGDTAATTDGAGNETAVSISPNNQFVPIAHVGPEVHNSYDYQQTNSSGLSGNTFSEPWIFNYTQTKRSPPGNFISPLIKNVNLYSGGTNLNGQNGEGQVELLNYVSRTPIQSGGISANNINCFAIGDCVRHEQVFTDNGISRGTDEGPHDVARFFASHQNSNWAGTLTLGSVNSIGDQAQTINCNAIAGGYCGNTFEQAILIDITKKTSNHQDVGISGSVNGQFITHNVPTHGLGTSTFTTTTAEIDNRVYTGTCPSVTPTGSTYPTIGANQNANDAFSADITGVGVPQINGNFVNTSGGSKVGYCINVASSTGFNPGDKITIYDAELDSEATTILAVPDSTHITAYIHYHHATGATISKGGGAGWGMCNTADDYPIGTLSAEQNGQAIVSRMCYPIVYTPDANNVVLYVNSDVELEYKTRGYDFTAPLQPVLITATGGGSTVNSITVTQAGNYNVASNGGGGMPFLPAPTTTSDCSGTQPNITWAIGTNVNVATWIPTLTNPGAATGCPSTPHITVSSNITNNVYFVPLNWSYRIADPNFPSGCASGTTQALNPSKCSVGDGYILTFPWLQTVANADEIDNTRWWQRFPDTNFEVESSDPATTFTGRTNPAVRDFTFNAAQSGQGFLAVTDATPSVEYIGASPDWGPTTANPTYGLKRPGSMFYHLGNLSSDYWMFPPHGNSITLGPPSSQSGVPNIGAPAFFFDCNSNPFGGLANQDNPCMHNLYYAWPLFSLNYAGHDTLIIDPGNDSLTWSNGAHNATLASQNVHGTTSITSDGSLHGQTAFSLGTSVADGSVGWFNAGTTHGFMGVYLSSNHTYVGFAASQDGSLPTGTPAFTGFTAWYDGVGLWAPFNSSATATPIFGINTLDQCCGPHGLGNNMFGVNLDGSVTTFHNILDGGANGGIIKPGYGYDGPATAPSGSCSIFGWVFSQDGNITHCTGTAWASFGGGGSMTWPTGGAGIPNYSGSSSWGTSYSATNLIPANFISTLNQNTTGTAANLSGTPALPNGTTATTQSPGDSTTKIATDAFVLANAGTGFANPMTTLGDMIDGGASGAAARLAGPTSGTVAYNLCSTPSGGVATAPIWCLPGQPGRTVTGTTDTIAATDRLNVVTYNSASAVAVTLTSAATLANNFIFSTYNKNAGAVTFTPGAGTINGGSTLVVNEGENCIISSPDNTNYTARCSSGQVTAGTGLTATRTAAGLSLALSATPNVGAATGTSLLLTGNVDGTAPTTITTGTTASLGGTFKSGYTWNQEATAATAIAYTLPTAAQGLQYCVGNSWNGTAATTGVLTVNTSASGQFIIFTDGTLSATGGNVTSGGAAGDMACFGGIDSTHWQQSTVRGTWTKH